MKVTLSGGNLNKTHILSLGVPWFVLDLWQRKDRENTRKGNLKKSDFNLPPLPSQREGRMKPLINP